MSDSLISLCEAYSWPRVIKLLREGVPAKQVNKAGREGLTPLHYACLEEQLEVTELLLQQLQDPANPHHAEFELKTRQKVRVPTEQLVSALNEHLEVRRKGNDLYQAKRFAEALQQYRRALSVVELVVGLSGEDQKEVDTNRIAVQLNIAAVHIARQDFGQAVEACDKALALKPDNVKALLRRAKALLGRHEYARALEDLEAVKAENAQLSIQVAERDSLVATLRSEVAATGEFARKSEGQQEEFRIHLTRVTNAFIPAVAALAQGPPRPPGNFVTPEEVSMIVAELGKSRQDLALAANREEELRSEAADLLYHLLVLLEVEGLSVEEVVAELDRRHRKG